MKSFPLDSNPRVAMLMIIIVSAVVYSGSLWNGFVWDDWELIVNNEAYRSFDLGGILAGRANTLEYLPVRDVSLALDAQLWGGRPFGYHLTNVLLYLAGTAAIFFLVRSMSGLIGLTSVTQAGFWTALVFSLHPLHAEVANFITARNTLLAGLFLFLSFVTLFSGLERSRTLPVVGALGLFALAVFSKAIAIFAPAFLLFLFPLIPSAKVSVRKKASLLAAFTVVAAAAAWVHYRNAVDAGIMNEAVIRFGSSNPLNIIGKALQIPMFYARLVLIPYPLSVDYPVVFSGGPTAIRSLVVLLALVLISASAWKLRTRAPLAVLGSAWYLLSLIPVLNLFPTHPVVADRYAYFAVAGVGMVIAQIAIAGGRRTVFALACLCIVWAGISMDRTLDWRSDDSLWRSAISVDPNSSRANLGEALWRQGRYDEAMEQLREDRLRRGSHYASFYEGRLHLQAQRLDEAIAAFQRAAAEGGDAYREVLVSLGSAYEQKGESRRALETYLRAAESGSIDVNGRYEREAQRGIERLRPLLASGLERRRLLASGDGRNDPRAVALLGLEYHALGMYEHACAEYRRSLELDPGRWDVWYNLGLCEVRQKRYPESARSLERAYALHQDASILNNQGVVFMKMQDLARAEAAYRQALEKDPRFFYAAFNYARVAFMRGDAVEARERFGRARLLAAGSQAFERRVDQYLQQVGKK